MIVHQRLLIPILFSLVLDLRVNANQPRNVILDDRDPAIVYAPPGAWHRSERNPMDYCGSHQFTKEPNATATLNFTGTAIYFLSPRWPYNMHMTTAVSLNSGPIHIIDLKDHSRRDAGSGEPTNPQVVWWCTGLDPNKQHTLQVSVGKGQRHAIVDALMYTEMIPTSSSTSSSSTSPSSTSSISSTSSSTSFSSTSFSSTSSSSTSSSESFSTSSSSASPSPRFPAADDPGTVKNLSISLGAVIGILAVVLIIVYISHRRRRKLKAWTIDGSPSDGNSVISNNGNGRGNSQPPGNSYPLVHPYQYSTADETWRSSQYGFANMTSSLMSPPHSTQQFYYPPPQNHYDPGPSQYAPGYPLSPIPGSSSPPLVGPHAPLLASSSAIGSNMVTPLNAEDLPVHNAAAAKEHASRKPLVVVGGPVDEVEAYDGNQFGQPSTEELSPTDAEESVGSRIRSLRRSL